MYSSSIPLQVFLRGRGSTSSTVHYTLLYRSYKFRTRALTLRLSFAVLKIINSTAIKLEVFCLGRDVLSRIAQGIDLHTSAKFRAFITNLNNDAPFFFTTFQIDYPPAKSS